MTGILERIKREFLKKGRNVVILEGKYQIQTLRIGAVEINTYWHCRYLQQAKKLTKAVSFYKLSATGMTSHILSAKMSDDC